MLFLRFDVASASLQHAVRLPMELDSAAGPLASTHTPQLVMYVRREPALPLALVHEAPVTALLRAGVPVTHPKSRARRAMPLDSPRSLASTLASSTANATRSASAAPNSTSGQEPTSQRALATMFYSPPESALQECLPPA